MHGKRKKGGRGVTGAQARKLISGVPGSASSMCLPQLLQTLYALHQNVTARPNKALVTEVDYRPPMTSHAHSLARLRSQPACLEVKPISSRGIAPFIKKSCGYGSKCSSVWKHAGVPTTRVAQINMRRGCKESCW